MANSFINLPVTAGDGVGAWVDVSAQGPERTVSVDGGAFGGSLTLEGSNDAQASAAPAIVGPFIGPTFVPQTFVQAFNFLRVRRVNSGGVGTPTVNVGAPPGSTNAFGAIAVPDADGVGAATDISGGGDVNTIQVVGDFTGQLLIETSTDGASFSPTLIFTNGGGVGQQIRGVLKSVRVRRRGVAAGAAPLVSVGSQSTTSAGAGGGTVNSVNAGTAITITGPATDPVVNNVGVTSLVAGAGIGVSAATGAVTVTNTGVTSAVAGAGIGVSAATGAVTFTNTGVIGLVAGAGIGVSAATGVVTITATVPAFGGAPPQVASASAAGAAGAAARSDHTHGQDLSVVYAPTLAAGQASGVFQQTYAAPNATPSVLTMVAKQVPFGAGAGGLLTQSANFSYTDGGALLLQGLGAAALQLNATTNTGANSNITYRFAGANYCLLTGTPGAAGTTNSFQIGFTPLAGGTGDDSIRFLNTGVVQPVWGVSMVGFDVFQGAPLQIAAAGVTGFVWIPTVAGPPTGVPSLAGVNAQARNPIVIDNGDHRFYWRDQTGAAWHFAEFNDYAATATRVPFGGATAHTLVDSAGFTFATATRALTLGTTGVGVDGSLLVNSGANGQSIGGATTAGIYVADPNAAGRASVAVDNYFFGQRLVGYSNLNLTDLGIGVGGNANTFHVMYAMDRAGGGTDAITMDSNSGQLLFGVAIAGRQSLTVSQPAGANLADVLVGGAAVAASTHGYPYVTTIAGQPTGVQAKPFGAGIAAFAYDSTHTAWNVFDPVGNQWLSIPMFNVTLAAGAGVGVINNLPAGFGVAAKWWNFTSSAGINCVVPYFTNP